MSVMRFATNLDNGVLGMPDSEELWADIWSHIPESVLTNKKSRFLFPAIGHGTELKILCGLLKARGWTKRQIINACHIVDKYRVFTNPIRAMGFKNVYTSNFLEWETDMKFDVVVGNPPYQDGSKEGGQNKIYNLFAKKALALGNIVAMITPTSVLKKSKRFSLIGQEGLKVVNFTANNSFDVGVKICYWIIDKTYHNNVTVIDDSGIRKESNTTVIYDYSIVDRKFAKLYHTLKGITDSPEKRMFRENNFGDAVEKNKKQSHPYTLCSVTKDKTTQVFGYSKRKPFFYGKKKIIIPMTKTVTNDSVFISKSDYYVAYLCTEIKNMTEASNIKSFIMSEYFQNHAENWRNLDGYGFNYALKYLPPFDKTKPWTNEEVKEFIESFLNE